MADSASTFLDEALHLIRPGADLYVEQVGPSDAPPVVYLHGGPGASAHAFRELLGEDLERFRMVYFDQRGGGRSYADEPFDLDTLAHDLAAILKQLEIPRATLLAHGFGAMVAVRTEVLHPTLVAGHVWINPWLSMPVLAGVLGEAARTIAGDDTEDEDELSAPADVVDRAFARVGAKPLLDQLLFPNPAARLYLEHAESNVLLGPSESATIDNVWSLDVSDALGMLRTPIAALFATHDRSCTPSQAELALVRLPQALTALLPGGHHPYAEDVGLFLDTLLPALHHAGASEGVESGAESRVDAAPNDA